MKNIALIPDVLSATEDLMNSICNKIPPKGTQDDILNVITSHKSSIKKVSKKVDPLIKYLNLMDKIDDKYSEIKMWSKEHTECALPVIAWNYFVHSIVNSDEDSLIFNVVGILPIVDRSFTDYYLQVN